MEDGIRLSRLMAQQGLCSRREADRLIATGQVQVDGVVIDQLGSKVHPLAAIELTSEARRQRAALATVLLNKPPGIVSNQPEKGYPEAVSLITEDNRAPHDEHPRRRVPKPQSLHVAGRLDIDSSGLLVLTQDGTVARTLIGPESRIEKEYHVGVDGNITETALQRLRQGVEAHAFRLPRRADDLETRQVSKISKIRANFCKILQIFGGLVLGCIKTKFCKKICV